MTTEPLTTPTAAHPPPAPDAAPRAADGRDAPLWRLWQQAAGLRGRLLAAAAIGGLASGCAVALMATSAWLIARAARQPLVLFLMVAVVAVRAFGIGRGVLRYAERLFSHDAAFRVLGRIRRGLVGHLGVLAPTGLPLWRRGDLLARTVDDVDDAGDPFLRGLLPLGAALLADEPAAHLDGPTADAVTGVVMTPAAARSVVLVSHRPRDADIVVRLDRGRMHSVTVRDGAGR